MTQYTGILGIIALLAIAFGMSNNRKAIDKYLIVWGLGLQLVFGLFILKTPMGQPFFSLVDKVVKKLISFLELKHPYECPSIIAFPIKKTNDKFLNWVKEQTA